MVKNTLQKLYNVTLVNNGERALQFLERKQTDLILLDILMPGLDGLETLQKIKENPESRHIPVIMLTALADEETLNECKRLGADGLITKPFLPGRMLETVQKVLEGAGTV